MKGDCPRCRYQINSPYRAPTVGITISGLDNILQTEGVLFHPQCGEELYRELQSALRAGSIHKAEAKRAVLE